MRLCFQSSELCALLQLRNKALQIQSKGKGRLKILTLPGSLPCFTLTKRGLTLTIIYRCNYKTTHRICLWQGTFMLQSHPFYFCHLQKSLSYSETACINWQIIRKQTKVILAFPQNSVLKMQYIEKWLENGNQNVFWRHAYFFNIGKSF